MLPKNVARTQKKHVDSGGRRVARGIKLENSDADSLGEVFHLKKGYITL